MRSRSAGVASIGTRSLSCRFTPQAPTSASIATASTGGSGRADDVAERIAAAIADGPQTEGELVLRPRGVSIQSSRSPDVTVQDRSDGAQRGIDARELRRSARSSTRHGAWSGIVRARGADQSIARRVHGRPQRRRRRRRGSRRRTPRLLRPRPSRPRGRRRRPESAATAPTARRRRRARTSLDRHAAARRRS